MAINKAQVAFASVALALIFPSVAHSQPETSSHRVLGSQGCVNLRAEPSITAAVLTCLPVGTNVQVLRMPPTGRFAWVNDEVGRTWYMALVPNTNVTGWIIPDCTDIFDVREVCNDYGSVDVAQTNDNSSVEQLSNAIWREVPGADFGLDPAPTRINTNGIVTDGDLIVFDTTGHQGFYYRLEGNCVTREVRILRHGAALGDTEFTYTEGASQELANAMLDLHLNLLDFACTEVLLARHNQSTQQPQIPSVPSSTSSPAVVSDTPLTGVDYIPMTTEIDGERTIARATRGEVTVEVRYSGDQPCNQDREHGLSALIKYGFQGIYSLNYPGYCFRGIHIVNLDSDEEYEIIVDLEQRLLVDRPSDELPILAVIFDERCTNCNTPAYQLRVPFPFGYRLEDLYEGSYIESFVGALEVTSNNGLPVEPNLDGALEIIANGFPVTILQLRSQEDCRPSERGVDLTENPRLLVAREIARRLRENYSGWRDGLDFCPCDEAVIQGDPRFEKSTHSRTGHFHPGAVSEYRSVRNIIQRYPSSETVPLTLRSIRPGQQCTYDARGQLINSGAGAGTPDAYSALINFSLDEDLDLEGAYAEISLALPNLAESSPDLSSFVGAPSYAEISLWRGTSNYAEINNIVNTHHYWDVLTFDGNGNGQALGWREYQQTWVPNQGIDERGTTCPVNNGDVAE